MAGYLNMRSQIPTFMAQPMGYEDMVAVPKASEIPAVPTEQPGYLDQANNWAAKLGSVMGDQRVQQALLNAGQLATTFGTTPAGAVRGKAMADALTRMATGGTLKRVTMGEQTAPVQPQVQAPSPAAPQSTAPMGKLPGLMADPYLQERADLRPFQEGVGGNAATPAPMMPAPAAPIPAPVPSGAAPVVVPSVQNLNIGSGVDDLTAATLNNIYGPEAFSAMLKQGEATRIGRTKEYTDLATVANAAATARASDLSARAAMLKAQVELAATTPGSPERRKKEAEIAKMQEEVIKSQFERSPAYIERAGKVKEAEALGDQAAKRAAVEDAAKEADKFPVSEPTLNKMGIKTFGDAIRATGQTDPSILAAAIRATSDQLSSGITAGAEGKKALAVALDSLDKELKPYMTMQPQLPTTDPGYKTQQAMLSLGTIKILNATNVAEKNRIMAQQQLIRSALMSGMQVPGDNSKGAERRASAGKQATGADAAITEIVVGGKKIKGAMQPDGSFKAEDGRVFRQKK